MIKAIVSFIIVSLFSVNSYAKECFNPGGTYTMTGILESNTCPNDPKKIMDLPDFTFEKTKCSTDYQTRLMPKGKECIVLIGMLINYEEERVSGYGLIHLICPTSKCESSYKLIFNKKENRAEK